MNLTKQESLRVMQMWNDYGNYLEEIFVRLLKDYEQNLNNNGDGWFNAKQLVEYLAKKQVLIELKKLLSNHYE